MSALVGLAIRAAGLFGVSLSPFLAQLAVYTLAAGAVAGVALKIRTDGFNAGHARAIAEVAAQDEGAINAAKEGRSRFRACVDVGGVWDVTTGKCQGRGMSRL